MPSGRLTKKKRPRVHRPQTKKNRNRNQRGGEVRRKNLGFGDRKFRNFAHKVTGGLVDSSDQRELKRSISQFGRPGSMRDEKRLYKAQRGSIKDARTFERQREIQKKKNYNEAKFIIKSIKNRSLTILNVCKEIFTRQIDFLSNGDIGMKPMTLKDIAESLGIHESTVSRATSNKFVQTPRGVYELKYFFTDSIKLQDGKEVGTFVIKQALKKIIDSENKHQPLSDDILVGELENQGYLLARRTIAKYRDQLGFPVARLRKEI